MGIVTAAKWVAVSVSVCLSLSLISGGPFWSLLYFIVLGRVWEGGLSSWGVSVPSETFTKVMFSCLWWAPSSPLPSGIGGLDCWLLFVSSGIRETRLRGGPSHGTGDWLQPGVE